MSKEEEKEKKTDRLAVRVTPSMKAEIEAAAESEGRSPANWVLRAIEEKLSIARSTKR